MQKPSSLNNKFLDDMLQLAHPAGFQASQHMHMLGKSFTPLCHATYERKQASVLQARTVSLTLMHLSLCTPP